MNGMKGFTNGRDATIDIIKVNLSIYRRGLLWG